jgi:membrane protein
VPRAVDDHYTEPQSAPPPKDDPGERDARTDVVTGPIPLGTGIGRNADTPVEIPWRGWKAVLRRVFREIISDSISLVAAGCAFYATLALFPAITMFVSIYGLVFDPKSVEPQLRILANLMPPAAYQLIHDRVQTLVSQPAQTLGLGLLISAAVAFWSSATGTKSMLSALNVAYEETEKRSFLQFQMMALAITLLTILGAVMGLAILVGLPAAFSFVGISEYAKQIIRVLSFGVLVLFVMTGLSLLYRYGPSRRPATWHWVTPGSGLATALWLLASVLFSIYVGRFASYNITYGPIGAVVAVMMWFYVSVYVVLLGAELNAELELQTARDSTDGASKPMGDRGAFVADHVAR